MQTALPISLSLRSEEKSKLWAAADALRGHLDAAEYKHTVLGLIFLTYISDAFDERHADLEAEQDQGADPEEKDEYAAVGVESARGCAFLPHMCQPVNIGVGHRSDQYMPRMSALPHFR